MLVSGMGTSARVWGDEMGERRHIGRLVRARREGLGLSQSGLAQRTGLGQTYISRIERGQIEFPQDATLERLGAVLGISLPEFYREGGRLEGIETDGDGPRPDDPLETVVELIRDDPDIMAQLAEAQREASPEVFEAGLRALAEAWRANVRMSMATLRLGLRGRAANGKRPS